MVFTAPLLLSGVPLLVVLDLSKLVDHLLVGCLVRLRFLIVSLELLDLPTARHALLLLVLLDRPLTLQRSLQEQLISIELLLVCFFSELLLSCIVRDEFKIALSIEQELLLVVLLLFLLLDGPLLPEHGLFASDQLLVLITLRLPSVLLPVQHLHRVPNLLLFLLRLSHLTLKLLLSIELPQLSVDLLLEHLLLNVSPLVNELFFALNRSAIVVELLVLLPQRVVLLLKLHVLPSGHLVSPLLLSLSFEHLEPLKHFLTHLLRGLHVIIEFLLVDSILSCQQLGQAGLSLLKIRSLTPFHIGDTVPHDAFLNDFPCLNLPIGLMLQILEASDVIHTFGLAL